MPKNFLTSNRNDPTLEPVKISNVAAPIATDNGPRREADDRGRLDDDRWRKEQETLRNDGHKRKSRR